MDEKRLAFYRSTLHPLFSIIIPFLFIWVFATVLRLTVLEQLGAAPPSGFIVLVLAVGIGEALSANALSRRKIVGALPRVREILLFLIGSMLVLYLITGSLQQGRYNPLRAQLIVPFLLVLAQWLLSFFIHHLFISRELFLGLLVGKSGAVLKSAVRDAFDESGAAEKGIRKIRRMLISFMIIVFLLFLISCVAGTAPASVVALCVSFELVGTVFLVLLNEFLSEQALLGEGLAVSRGIRVGRTRMALFSLVLVALIGLLLAGRQSILPPSLLAAAFNALSQMFTFQVKINPANVKQPQPPQEDQTMNQGLGNPAQALAGLGQESPFAKIARIIGIVLAVIIGILLLYFLVRPLLSRETRQEWKGFHPIVFLKERFRRLLGLVRKALNSFTRWLRSPKKGMTRAVRAMMQGLRDTMTRNAESRAEKPTDAERERRRKLSRIVREFVRLIHWGERGGVRFDKSVGPFEFADLLASSVPEKKPALQSVAGMFEELVFSSHAIEQAMMAEYFKGIESIVRYRPVRSER